MNKDNVETRSLFTHVTTKLYNFKAARRFMYHFKCILWCSHTVRTALILMGIVTIRYGL